jgi:hypothetical protein
MIFSLALDLLCQGRTTAQVSATTAQNPRPVLVLAWHGGLPGSPSRHCRCEATYREGFQSASTPENPDSLRPLSGGVAGSRGAVVCPGAAQQGRSCGPP